MSACESLCMYLFLYACGYTPAYVCMSVLRIYASRPMYSCMHEYVECTTLYLRVHNYIHACMCACNSVYV